MSIPKTDVRLVPWPLSALCCPQSLGFSRKVFNMEVCPSRMRPGLPFEIRASFSSFLGKRIALLWRHRPGGFVEFVTVLSTNIVAQRAPLRSLAVSWPVWSARTYYATWIRRTIASSSRSFIERGVSAVLIRCNYLHRTYIPK